MPFDGITVNSVVEELNKTLINARVEKIYQPEKDEIVLHVRKEKDIRMLLISINPSLPKIHLTKIKKNNPLTAPTFCMLLRKHLMKSRVNSITQPSLERLIEIKFQCIDEMGYELEKSLIIEIMGRHSNAILIETDSLAIIDSIKRVNKYMSRYRTVLPGEKYNYPPSKNKTDPFTINEKTFYEDIKTFGNDMKIYKYLIKKYYGISPIVAQEICINANIHPEDSLKEVKCGNYKELFSAFDEVLNKINNKKYQPYIVIDNNKYFDFASIDLNIYNTSTKLYMDSISEIIETFYKTKDNIDRMKQKSNSIRKVISNKLKKDQKKLIIIEKELKEAGEGDQYRIYADSIMSSLYMLKKGNSIVSLPSYHNENTSNIEIRLDPNLTPVDNAQKYYKMYNKSKSALNMLNKQIIKTKDEILYLESVLDSLDKCNDEKEIDEIKMELFQEGYIKKYRKHKDRRERRSKQANLLHFISSSNFNIYVGKNNTQNDYITQKLAKSDDIWMHVKDIAGSHVIIKTEGKDIDKETLIEAANLAAYYSKARFSSNVPVDYTYRKNVKKPLGAKPGMVIYNSFKTIYVTPKETI